MSKVQSALLPGGVEIPMIGLGTFRSSADTLRQAVKSALDIGYTSFDTAWIYENGKDIAKAIADRDRKELFITDKLWNAFQGFESTKKAFDVTLSQLETDYIDLYLVHWPGKDKFLDTWKAFEELYAGKKIRAIGVSNFMTHHLEVLLENCSVPPMVNQIEAHCYYMDYKTIEFCREHSILVEAWAPLGYGSNMLKEKALEDIADAHGKTPAQVALRFLIQNGIRVLPKSVNAQRQKENFEIFDFELTDEQMESIRKINKGQRLHADPDTFF